ncbi:PDR/VanB family oxidoreductase [Hydrogenophaga sp.]|jgi:ferredoxin-NADP reductase|uniref:PDR/VanB family oxidoreductase n=1 Tax=Hydrogenophaga sp. TaxID=1904254 RepID=UPI00391CB9F5
MNANTPPNGPLAVRLRSITYAARDTHLYEFVRLDGQAMPDVAPGAHVDLHLPNGTVRPYSLVRAGQGLKSYVVGVKLDPKSRGGSRYIHEKLMAGTEMSLSEPRNHFPLKEDAPHTVLIAGGIGITPIWCMAQRLQAIGASWELWYSCRSRADAAFLDEMAAFGDRVHLHFDEEAGHLLDLQALVAKAAPDAHLYCCGPAPMLAAYEAAAASRQPETVHLEHFGAVQAAATDGGFVVELARTGGELTVPQGKSILEVLTAHNVSVNSSCLQGVCGYCEVAVLQGEVDHRDAILTPSERASNSTMMVCCSGAKSARLVLDL